MSTAPKPQIDRQTTTPFHLKLFYRVHGFHHLSDFNPSSLPSRGGPASGPNAIRTRSPPPPQLPAHLQIYTWESCTLRELSQLLTSALPSLLPDPPVGTRLCFRLIYPDTRGAATMGPDARGRYLSKDMGSVIVGPRDSPYRDEKESEAPATGPRGSLRLQGNDAHKSLQDMRFVIGDFVDCAVLPPLENGDVAPPIISGRGPVGASTGGGMRAFRENGFGRPGRGRGDRGGIPSGDWRRGERLPEGGRGGFGRRGWAPY
ncbi:Sin3-associated polypeptide Sap18 [Aspergillus sclerotialis]|uniref:Sin3-associated polypeptide Sap18 n=1 Tax=Aspergillus sclerotialis TaxID=2070753 RepID=A0A3A2ZI48_9EURO|nr:Sin3-associated polypeptide Sap18 [Aspergillus sclerotialis]